MNAGDAKKLRQKHDRNTNTNAKRRRSQKWLSRRFSCQSLAEYGRRMESHERAVATCLNGAAEDDDLSAMERDDTQEADL